MSRDPFFPKNPESDPLLRRPLPRVRPKLAIGRAGGAAELAADEMASQVLNGKTVSRAEQATGSDDAGMALNPALARDLTAGKGAGAPLGESVRQQLEPRFAYNFSDVRIHNDAHAHAMNRKLGAQAFTHGSDIFLSSSVRPDVNPVMAHELAHVTQQTGMVQCYPYMSPHGEKGFTTVPGKTLFRRIRAKGTQTYFYNAEKDPKNVPLADLFELGQLVGVHGVNEAGPYWHFGKNDEVIGMGSSKKAILAKGKKECPVNEPRQNLDAPWVEMKVAKATGTMEGVTFIRRIEVKGGANRSSPGREWSSDPYECVYDFYIDLPAQKSGSRP